MRGPTPSHGAHTADVRRLRQDLAAAPDACVAIIRPVNRAQFALVCGYEKAADLLAPIAWLIELAAKPLGMTLYRLHGDDFGLLWKARGLDAAADLNRLIETLAESPLWHGGNRYQLCFRAGASLASGTGCGLTRAYAALKTAEHRHEAIAWHYAETPYGEEAAMAHAHALRIRDSLADGSACIALQPVVNADPGSGFWQEALLRIPDGNGGFLPPEQAVAHAQAYNLGHAVTRFVLTSACSLIRDRGQTISVNLTAQDITDPRIGDIIRRAFPQSGGARGKLILEITERDEIRHPEAVSDFISRMHSLGCKVAIDDFGAGYANFRFLLGTPADIVKIDGSLVRDFLSCDQTRFLVKGLLSFCQYAGRTTVAEYVENAELARALASHGATWLQGYHVGKPEIVSFSTSSTMAKTVE